MRTLPATADVVVIGGGPAGSTAANALAQEGYAVVLLEKAVHPRPTVGESILPFVWRYADLLGVTAELVAEDFLQKSGGTTVWDEAIQQMTFGHFDFDRPALHVERDTFDDLFLRAAGRAGAQVFESVTVQDVDLGGAGANTVRYVDGTTGARGTVTCSYLIDASGQGAVLGRQEGFREFDRDLRFMGVWGYFERTAYVALGGGILPFDQRRTHPPTTLITHLGDWGWCWHIVLRDCVSVGLVLPPEQYASFKTLGSTLEGRFVQACQQAPLVADLLDFDTLIPGSVRALRDFAYYPRELAGDGWFLAGDAAAFVDPINSAGVMGAFHTGYMAALTVAEALQHPARREVVTARYAELLKGRLAVYRLTALPVGVNSYPEMHRYALQCIKQLSDEERELIYVQMKLIHRTENLEPLYALDPLLPPLRSDRFHELARLVA
ncbi:MAG: NAD(P)/FAD-dependent oxidoreductase [Rhodothermales bacterium]|nr:NAD(P)/FAD-dependent oxidoreductase [Rhodothermales bacterium]